MRSIVLASMLLAATAAAADPTYTVFTVHHAPIARASAVNANGAVAGDYYPGNRRCQNNCSFLRMPDGSLKTFTLPGARALETYAINAANTIAGRYLDEHDREAGFLRHADGTVVRVRLNHATTWITALNDSGVAAGSFLTKKSLMKPFVRLPDGSIETFDSVNRFSSAAVTGINASGTVVGYTDLLENHGFIRALGSAPVKFDIPGDMGAQGTSLHAIDDQGDIAGDCTDAGSHQHLFLRDPDGTLHFFDLPSGNVRAVVRVGGDTQVVGYFLDSDTFNKGFIRHQDGTIETFNRAHGGLRFGGTVVFGASTSGVVVGYLLNDIIDQRGFIRTP